MKPAITIIFYVLSVSFTGLVGLKGYFNRIPGRYFMAG